MCEETTMKQQRSETSFEFINVTGGSGRERRRNNYLARAHAAKINRQNYKIQQSDSRRSKATTLSILPKRSKNPESGTTGTDEDASSDGGRGRSRSLTVHSSTDFSRNSRDGSPDSSEQHMKDETDASLSLQNISPVFGALAIDTFDWTSQPISSQVSHYLLKVSWPARSGTEVTKAWWNLFCTSSIVYHVSHLASAVHRDLLVGESDWSSSAHVLMHKTRTIQMINEQLARLSSLDRDAVDQLIFAVTTLSRHEMEAKHLQSGEVLLFTPHMPHANGMKPLGRLNLSQSARTLLVQLVNSQGGLDKLAILGLGDILALIDILESSTDMSKPRFPPFWDVGGSMGFKSFAGIGHVSPGRGFFNLFGTIPTPAINTLRALAHADMIMSCHDLVPLESDFYTVLSIRNSAIHSILSLPPWEELSVSDIGETDFALYEACRITAVIYSNAVLLGLPTHSGWHQNFISKLRDVLQSTDLSALAEYSPDVLVWILFVAAISSYRTPHRCFFETSLRDALLLTGMLSWHSVKRCLGEFLWSEDACEHGAAVIWDAMDLENTWPR